MLNKEHYLSLLVVIIIVTGAGMCIFGLLNDLTP